MAEMHGLGARTTWGVVSPPRFLCDVMLGRLARWLRLLGYDTFYSSSASDRELVRRAGRERRILLTRDTRIPRAPGGVRVIRVLSDAFEEQLRQVLSEVGHPVAPGLFRRCTLCNTELLSLPASALEGKVPDYIRNRHGSFASCPTCRRIYWPGSHHRQMLRTLRPFL